MRVVVDGYWWATGPPSGRGVVRELVREWARSYPDDELVLTVPRADEGSLMTFGENVTVHPVLSPQHALSVMIEVPRVARRYGADVCLCQNFTPLRGTSVTFVHDVLFQSNPEWFTRPERAYLAPVPLLARAARCVLTSSNVEAGRIRRHNPHLRNVVPVGLAAASQLLEATPSRPLGLGSVDGFLLTVGRLNVRKNLSFALDAAVMSGVLSPKFPFVVVGESDGRREALSPQAKTLVDSGAIRFMGGVSNEELAWLYSHANLFVFLSRDEGFGLPPVEAQAFGCPVIVSDIPVMREVCTSSAHFVGLTSVQHVGRAIAGAIPGGGRTPGPAQSPYSWAGVVEAARTAVALASEVPDGAHR